jgi:hypothetical protein
MTNQKVVVRVVLGTDTEAQREINLFRQTTEAYKPFADLEFQVRKIEGDNGDGYAAFAYPRPSRLTDYELYQALLNFAEKGPSHVRSILSPGFDLLPVGSTQNVPIRSKPRQTVERRAPEKPRILIQLAPIENKITLLQLDSLD